LSHQDFIESESTETGVNNYFTEMCSGSEAGAYLRRIDFVHHSTLGLRVIKKKKRRIPNSESRNPNIGTRNPETRILGDASIYFDATYPRNPKSETRSQQPETRNQKPDRRIRAALHPTGAPR